MKRILVNKWGSELLSEINEKPSIQKQFMLYSKKQINIPE